METTALANDVCGWPVLSRLAPGMLGIVHYNRPDHGLSEGDLSSLISIDEGATWQNAGIAAPHDPGCNRMHVAAGVDRTGRWLVFSTGMRLVEGGYAGLEPLWLSICDTPGGPWRVTRSPLVTIDEPFAIPHGRILPTADGRLVTCLYRSQGKGNPSRTWLISSADNGVSWAAEGEIGGGDSNEAVLLPRPGGDWLAAVRTHVDHHLSLHQSSDTGRTWSQRCDLTLPMQHPGDLTVLEDGQLLLTYGLRNRGLMGIGARRSRDGGATWGPPVVLYQFGDATDCGYPSTIVCTNGDLLTACYTDLSPLYDGYHLLLLRWRIDEFFGPRPLRSISDGRALQA